MPAYSFQERFIPSILDGSKTHTIRAQRKGRHGGHAKVGDKLYLYYGLRTKNCRKIGIAICSRVDRILITKHGVCLDNGQHGALLPEQLELFAWSDGFRPEDTTAERPDGAWEMMLRWWKQTHELPFEGVVIYWSDFIPA